MKKQIILFIGILLVSGVFGREEKALNLTCGCPSCVAEAKGEKLPYTLPELQELNERALANESHVADDHNHTDHEAHSDHDGHDHAAHDDHSDHEGHDHDDHTETAIELDEALVETVGIQIQEAHGGTMTKTSVFPAEIKLNRDAAAAVSPRYASIVRDVFKEIGDTVSKGDALATLENRDTMAVYTATSPIDGIIIEKDLAMGESAAEDRVMYKIADLSTVWADISIFPRYQHLMRKGMPVKFIAHDGHTTLGTVKYISPIISHETRTFTARSILEGADEDFTPGAFVRAKIDVETTEASVVVPREAVQVLEGQPMIFIPTGQGFSTVEVSLGLANDHFVEIVRGLNPGDAYVAVGAFALKAQMVTSGMDPHAGHGH